MWSYTRTLPLFWEYPGRYVEDFCENSLENAVSLPQREPYTHWPPERIHIHNVNSLAAISRSHAACALSRHGEPYKQSSWSRARNSQENRPFLTASGVDTWNPTWTIDVSWEKVLTLHPSKCQVPQSQLGGLVGVVGGRGRKTRQKIAIVGLELRPSGHVPRTQPLHRTHTHT